MIGEDFYEHRTLARAVKFVQENSLPGAEREFAVFDEDDLARSSEYGFHVRVSVAFGVAIRAFVLDQTIENTFDVAGDVGIGVLVDGDSGSGVRNVDVADATLHAGFTDGLFDFVRDVYKLGATIRFHAKSFHCRGKYYGMGMM